MNDVTSKFLVLGIILNARYTLISSKTKSKILFPPVLGSRLSDYFVFDECYQIHWLPYILICMDRRKQYFMLSFMNLI